MKHKMVVLVCMLACIGMLAGCGKGESSEPVQETMIIMDDVENKDTPMDKTRGDETRQEAVTAGSMDMERAKLQKEEQREQRKEELMEIINSAELGDEQKQQAADEMAAITDIAEKETSAEILLESKGFSGVVVSITDTGVDVVVEALELSEAQRAQIEDIIMRKTGVSPETIIISTAAGDSGQ